MRIRVLLTVGLLAAGCASAAQGPGTIVARPADTGAVLVNPGMGWVLHHYDNSIIQYGARLEPSDTVDDFPGVAVIYLRLAWSYIEPEEGKFNWSMVDIPAQRWIAKGKQIAFRFTCSESSLPNATPEWVRKAGAKGYTFRPRQGIVEGSQLWEPDFDDPIFLGKLDRFLASAAGRYDGNPEVAFIDVGSFGVWGEGHTGATTRLPYSAATVRKHIDLYRKYFKHTLLAANDDFANQGRGRETIAYARDQGLTLRDDSILVQGGDNAYFSAGMAPEFWPRVPVILESEHFGISRDRGFWGDGGKYLQAIEDYHASYASVHWWPREFAAENRQLIDRINRRLGYRLELAEASWPAEVAVNSMLPFRYLWRNAGVAPCLPGGYPAFTLKDDKGGVAAVFADGSFNVLSLPVAAPDKADARGREATFLWPSILKPGAYQVYISVGTRTGTPRIALPLADGDGQRRYRLGTLRVLDK
jgi:hypothetical protein